MISTTIGSRKRLGGTLVAVAIATVVGTTAAVGAAPTANATCASVFGVGNTVNCTSRFGSIAIAIGSNAIADAGGFLSVAFASGTGAGG